MRIPGFWTDVFAFRDSATTQVTWRALAFGLFAVAVCVAESKTPNPLGIPLAPYEVAGAALSLLLVLRTNAGYERWWEGRKLWGGVVNQCRNLTVTALAYGSSDGPWRSEIVRWTAAFPHVLRHSLRDERDVSDVAALLGSEAAQHTAAAPHMPSYVAGVIARHLGEAVRRGQLDMFPFLEAERQRALLMDHAGGCERIKKTPLPRAYSIQIRRFLLLFLVALPFALLHKLDDLWLVPVVTLLIAYPILTLDEIGAELQQPFAASSLNHLPLDTICDSLEKELLSMLEASPTKVTSKPAPRLDVT